MAGQGAPFLLDAQPALVPPVLPLGAASRLRLRPGVWLLVTFQSDPGWHNERVVLHAVVDDLWMILTPDGHEYAESLSDYSTWSILNGSSSYPPEATGGLVQFEVLLTDNELIDAIVRAQVVAVAERALRPGRAMPVDNPVALSWDGGPLGIPFPLGERKCLFAFG